MRERLVGVATCLAAVLGAVGPARNAAPPPQNEPAWLTDYDEARKLARASGKPIFVVFRCQH
jgi:hypothetical protein